MSTKYEPALRTVVKLAASAVVLGQLMGALAAAQPAGAPRRINSAIEMLLKDQPVYYTQTSGGGYEDGRRLAQTTADYITYEMEHGSFDMVELRGFMQGLVDGGPAPTGHRTPAVIATLPVAGLDGPSMRANA